MAINDVVKEVGYNLFPGGLGLRSWHKQRKLELGSSTDGSSWYDARKSNRVSRWVSSLSTGLVDSCVYYLGLCIVDEAVTNPENYVGVAFASVALVGAKAFTYLLDEVARSMSPLR